MKVQGCYHPVRSARCPCKQSDPSMRQKHSARNAQAFALESISLEALASIPSTSTSCPSSDATHRSGVGTSTWICADAVNASAINSVSVPLTDHPCCFTGPSSSSPPSPLRLPLALRWHPMLNALYETLGINPQARFVGPGRRRCSTGNLMWQSVNQFVNVGKSR